MQSISSNHFNHHGDIIQNGSPVSILACDLNMADAAICNAAAATNDTDRTEWIEEARKRLLQVRGARLNPEIINRLGKTKARKLP